jgi:prepilin-type N-terminal cleavage/methylation domain-containing protein
MTSLQSKQRGFTIVELLIVIVVIGILAALVVTTFTGIQQKSRNTERQTDIKAIHGQVEAYYAQNGSYPAMAELNDQAWRATNMKGLDCEALKDPKGTGAGTCAAGGAPYAVAAAATSTTYGYAPTKDDGTACTTAANDCTKYTLQANYEGGGNFTKSNLN